MMMKKNIIAAVALSLASIVHAQPTITLDDAIRFAAMDIAANVTYAEMVISGIEAPTKAESVYITEELTGFMVASGRFTVLARGKALDAVNAEHKHQMSGTVADDDIAGIGHALGAKTVITGTLRRHDGYNMLRIRAVDVKSSRILAQYAARVLQDKPVTVPVQAMVKPSSPSPNPSPNPIPNPIPNPTSKTIPKTRPAKTESHPPVRRGSWEDLFDVAAPPPAPKPTPTKSFTDPRDGREYRTVTIGGVTWMAENLNFAIRGSWCYDNDTSNCAEYGRLYNWKAAKNACQGMSGWHLPSRKEWKDMVDAVGGEKVAGKKLKAASRWGDYDYYYPVYPYNYNRSGNGTDDYHFSALPSGVRWTFHFGSSNFSSIGLDGHWWSATESGSGYAYRRDIYHRYNYVGEGDDEKRHGISVRCVREAPDATPNSLAPTLPHEPSAGGTYFKWIALGGAVFLAVVFLGAYLVHRRRKK